jgi:hypothetical protein
MRESGVLRAGVPTGSLAEEYNGTLIEPKISTVGLADTTVGVLILAFGRHPCGSDRFYF